MTKEERRTLIEKLPDAANLALGAMVFGQFFQDGQSSAWLALLGWALLLGGEGVGD